MKSWSVEAKVGLFAAAGLLILAYATIRVSDRTMFSGGEYKVLVFIDSAEGLTRKTPVEVAGIQVGFVDDLDLHEGRRARAILKLDRQVRLGSDASVQVRTKGFLGETYIDILPGHPEVSEIPDGGRIEATNPYVDLAQIAQDVREMTGSMKKMLSEEENGPVTRILKNMEVFTKKLSEMTLQNQAGVNEIVANLRGFSSDLREVMADKKETLKDTMDRLDSITRKVDEGRGTVGRLINDGELADNVNTAARGLSETLGGVNRFQVEMGYHMEYLGASGDFKNYVGLDFKPRPDKFFRLEFVVDPNPSADVVVTDTAITTGTTTANIHKEESVVEKDTFKISAQLAKSFYDFTFRGGLIESRGGVGLDYRKGPIGIEFTAFDFRTDNNQRPHLKVLGSLNVTRNLYVVSGLDDFLSTQQDPDWFVGAGLRLVDNDIKSLLGAASLR